MGRTIMAILIILALVKAFTGWPPIGVEPIPGQPTPTAISQPAPQLTSGQQARAGKADLEWTGEVLRFVNEDGKLAGGQVRARFDLRRDSVVWIDEIHLNGKAVETLPRGQVGTIWIKRSFRSETAVN